MTQSSVRTSSLSVTSPTSRPASYISIEESSGPEMSERNLESEDDGKQKDFFFSNYESFQKQNNWKQFTSYLFLVVLSFNKMRSIAFMADTNHQ